MEVVSVWVVSTVVFEVAMPFATVVAEVVAIDLRLRTRTAFGFGFGDSGGGEGGRRSSESRSLRDEDSEAFDMGERILVKDCQVIIQGLRLMYLEVNLLLHITRQTVIIVEPKLNFPTQTIKYETPVNLKKKKPPPTPLTCEVYLFLFPTQKYEPSELYSFRRGLDFVSQVI